MKSRRYIVPIIVFLVVRALLWVMEVRHRNAVADVYRTAEENGWPVVAVTNLDEESDYVLTLHTLNSDGRGVALGPGLGVAPCTTPSFAADGTICNLRIGNRRILVVFDPPDFVGELRVLRNPERRGIEFDRDDLYTECYFWETGFSGDDLTLTNFATGERRSIDLSVYPGWTDVEREHYYLTNVLLAADLNAIVIARRELTGIAPEAELTELWRFDFAESSFNRVMTESFYVLTDVSRSGELIAVYRLDRQCFDIVDGFSGETLYSCDDVYVEINHQWMGTVSDGPTISLYDIANEFERHDIRLIYRGQRQGIIPTIALYEP